MKMRVIQVAEKNGPLHLAERNIPEPGPGEVRVRVEACGVCHSDSLTVEGIFPGLIFPRVPRARDRGPDRRCGRWRAGLDCRPARRRRLVRGRLLPLRALPPRTHD